MYVTFGPRADLKGITTTLFYEESPEAWYMGDIALKQMNKMNIQSLRTDGCFDKPGHHWFM